jgi:WD40 repeat protein/predicted Ser/Thr protein kinase
MAVLAPEPHPAGILAPPSEASLLSIPGHEVSEEIARGGMGVVYRARQFDPNRTVALKMLLPHQTTLAEMRERFRLETRAIAALDHPAILPVYQVGEHERFPFFTMKYVSGGSLATCRDRYRGRFREIAELMITLADAIHFAHEHGVLHRDLKPGNILFDEAGRPYVSDFGMAKFIGADSGLTQSIDFLGTPHYVSPEVAARSARFATTASDLYSLGAIMYVLLAGRPPFEAEGVPALLKKIAEDSPPLITLEPSPMSGDERTDAKRKRRPKNTVPRELQVICLTCLAKDPSQRYGSAHELGMDLRRWLEGRPILAQPVSLSERLVKWAGRNVATATLTVLLLVALVGGAVTLAWSNRQLQHALRGSQATLHDSLIVQARLERKSGRIGQRSQALALMDRAVALSPISLDTKGQSRAALRTQLAAALALPDLRPIDRWPLDLKTPNDAVGTVGFDADLSLYATPAGEGGFFVRTREDRRVVLRFPGLRDNPPVQFKFSRTGPDVRPTAHWLGVIYAHGEVEIHELWSDRPPRRMAGPSALGTDLEFLPGTSSMALVGLHGGLIILDWVHGTTRELIPPPVSVSALKVDPRGERVACFSEKAVKIVQIEDSAMLWSVPVTHGTVHLAWSADGRQLAIAESVPPFEVTVLNLAPIPGLEPSADPIGNFNLVMPVARALSNALASRIVAHFQDHEMSVSHLAFHPDGGSLVSLGNDNRLVWRQLVQSGSRVVGHAGPRVLQFSGDGGKLAYQPGYGELGFLEVTPSTVLHEWRRTTPPDEETCMLTVSANGRLIATSSVREIQLWDTGAHAQIAHIPLPGRSGFVRVSFEREGRALLYSAPGAGITRVDLKNLPDHPGPFNLALDGARVQPGMVSDLGVPQTAEPRLSSDGRWALVTTTEYRQLWQVDSWEPGPRWAHSPQRDNWAAAFSDDGSWLATTGAEGRIEIRRLPEAELVLELLTPQPLRIRDLAFSPNRERLYLWQSTGRLLAWDLSQLRRELARRGLDWQD